MNKSRELFLLFHLTPILNDKDKRSFETRYNIWKQDITNAGYSLMYSHRFPNDEPPYIMVKYYGKGLYYSSVDYEEETLVYYLIRTKDCDRFINMKKEHQTEYCDYYLEGIYTRNAKEHNLKPEEYARRGTRNQFREAKIKSIPYLPRELSMISI